MNKKLFMAASVLALSGLLAACGTDDSSEDTAQNTASESEKTEKETTTSEENSADDSTKDESSEEESPEEAAEEDAADSETTEDSTEPAEEDPAVTEGTLTVSDSQPYELYLLDGYELTAEEPNKDVVFSTENDSLFMRVETFSTADGEFAYFEEEMLQTLQASNEAGELKELPAFEEAEFTNSAVSEVPVENGKVTGTVFEKGDLIVRLTIFDLTEASVTEDFLNMGKTISAQ